MRLEDLRGKFIYRRYPITVNEEDCERDLYDFMNPLEFIRVLEIYPNGAGALIHIGNSIYDPHTPLYMHSSTITPNTRPDNVRFIPSIFLDYGWEDATDVLIQIQRDYSAITNKAYLYNNHLMSMDYNRTRKQ